MCRSLSEGGRRCPCQSNPEYRKKLNERRRALRKAKKLGLPPPPLEHGRILVSPPASAGSIMGSASGYHEVVQRTREAFKNHDLYNPGTEVVNEPSFTKLGFYKTVNHGTWVDNDDDVSYGYFDKHTLHGVIHDEALNDQSYRDFGFTNRAEHWTTGSSIRGTNTRPFSIASRQVIEGSVSAQECATIKKDVSSYTDDSFTNINNILYSKKMNVGAREWLRSDGDKMFDSLDEAIALAPPVNKTVYRGIRGTSGLFNKYSGSIDKWIQDENIMLGSELSFDGYLSTTSDRQTVEYFSRANHDCDSVIFEIKTTDGLPVEAMSLVVGEQETILPRNTKFKVVGMDSAVKPGKRGKLHVIQMVAINSRGEILDGTNSDPRTQVTWDDDGNIVEKLIDES